VCSRMSSIYFLMVSAISKIYTLTGGLCTEN